ncbi:prenyltransferase [Curtobacterium ammoniigenes]|uniref:prenyltransferase n=1 Tax=Curtobacterium ammoniigenes TaxID=395387 RepID=UPI000830F259|nr:prenyltransferase [Curtobacterium ammoniigenes]
MTALTARPRPSLLASLFVASRPISWVNTAYPFAAAYVLGAGVGVHGGGGFHLAVLIVGTVFFLVPYNLAMYGINDVFDYESDLRNPRKGGVEGALLDRGVHRATLRAVVITTVPFLVVLVAVGGPWSWLVLAISMFAVVAYSAPGLRFKERPFLDSVTSSTHFVSPAIYGLVLAGPAWTPQLVAVCVAFFLWGVASHAFGAVQDVVADRAGGIGSVATVIGARTTVRLAFIAYLVAGLVMLDTAFPGPIAAIVVIPYALNVLPWWNVRDDAAESANAGWRRFLWINYLAGFLVTMALIGYAASH